MPNRPSSAPLLLKTLNGAVAISACRGSNPVVDTSGKTDCQAEE